MTAEPADPTLHVIVRDPREEPPYRAGARQLCDWVTHSGGRRFGVSLRFGAPDAGATGEPAPGMAIVSLAGDVFAADEPFGDVERRLHGTVAQLAACTAGPVFVATVFRHVEGADDPARARLLERIRRLDLLATQLSHAHGVGVVDVDRMLADAGGRRLGCDWRLESPAGVDAAGCVVASALLASALDDVLDPQDLQRAQAAHGGNARLRHRIERIVAQRLSAQAPHARA